MARRTILLVATSCLLCCSAPALGGEIHQAVEAGDLAKVEQILQKDPSALTQRDQGEFRELPIHYAARSGNVEIARLLLNAGAETDAGDSDNSTALGIAAMLGQGEMVAFLIKKGADVNHRDRKADCPLSFAVYGRDEAIIQQLLEAGADLYFRSPFGETLLHHACSRGVPGFVEHLLENGADLEAKAGNGGTPLAYAAMGGQVEIIKMLLEHGADPSPGQPGDVTPLLTATWRNQVEAARLLLENGAQVDRTDIHGNTALLGAAESCSAEMLSVLIEHGAKVGHLNEAGESALVKAAAGGHTDRVEVLLTADANPNRGADAGGRTALQLAAIGGYAEVVKRLLAGDADSKVVSPTGETVFDLASYYGHKDLVTALGEKGVGSGGSGSVDRSLAALGKVGKKEAVVWFLGHSGWAVKTRSHLLVFDYFSQGEVPASPALCNGHINPAEIGGQKVAVFASHHHGDHFDPIIFQWREHLSNITYFLGLEPEEAPAYEFMPERMEKSFGDLEITTIHSTDAGVGMVVEVDGLSIFHPGDHANGRIGLMKEFTDEIDFLASRDIRPDICFMGIRGCSLGSPEEVMEGVHYTLRKLEPKIFIPMHAGAQGHLYRQFIGECQAQFPSIQMVAPDNRGDHFVYSKGRIKDPRSIETEQARAERSAR